MSKRTDQSTSQDSSQPPAENRIVDEPATPENCAADYATGGGTRQSFDKHVQRYGGNWG